MNDLLGSQMGRCEMMPYFCLLKMDIVDIVNSRQATIQSRKMSQCFYEPSSYPGISQMLLFFHLYPSYSVYDFTPKAEISPPEWPPHPSTCAAAASVTYAQSQVDLGHHGLHQKCLEESESILAACFVVKV